MKWPGFPRMAKASGHGASGSRLCMFTCTVSSMLAIAHAAAVATASAAKMPLPALRKSRIDLTEISSSVAFNASLLPASGAASAVARGAAAVRGAAARGTSAAEATAPLCIEDSSSLARARRWWRRRSSSADSSSSMPPRLGRPFEGPSMLQMGRSPRSLLNSSLTLCARLSRASSP